MAVPREVSAGPRRSAFFAAALALMSVPGGSGAFAACVPANCDDNDVCTQDSCIVGQCLHVVTILCDDGNPCTDDQCNPVTGGCSHLLKNCNDNNGCTTDACNQTTGQCEHSLPAPCNDNNGCTTDTCDPATGQCLHAPRSCDDGDVCTTDTCNAITGICEHTSIPCVDNNVCTIDLCDPIQGCRHIPTVRCLVVNALSIKAIDAAAKVSFKRKGGTKDGQDFVTVAMQDVVLTSFDGKLVRKKVAVKAVVSGADAGIGSLLYPIVAVGAGAGALDAIRAQGYDVSVVGDLQPCQDTLPADACTAIAQQLSKAIDASLGDAAERAAFRQAAQALGYPPDVCNVIP